MNNQKLHFYEGKKIESFLVQMVTCLTRSSLKHTKDILETDNEI